MLLQLLPVTSNRGICSKNQNMVFMFSRTIFHHWPNPTNPYVFEQIRKFRIPKILLVSCLKSGQKTHQNITQIGFLAPKPS